MARTLLLVAVVAAMCTLLFSWSAYELERSARPQDAAFEAIVMGQRTLVQLVSPPSAPAAEKPIVGAVPDQLAVTSARVSPPPAAVSTAPAAPAPEGLRYLWANESKCPLLDIRRGDWMLYLRIQKTASKSFREALIDFYDNVALGWPNGFRCVTRDSFCTTRRDTECHQYTSCTEGIPAQKRRLTRPECHLISQPHADMTDLTTAFKDDKRPPHLITLVRHPVARVVSEYKSNVGKRCAWDYKVTSPRPESAKGAIQYVNNLQHATGARNRQTHMLAGWAEVERIRNSNITQAERDRQLVQAACNALDRMAFVALAERYDDSVEMLSMMMGLDYVAKYRKKLDATDNKRSFSIDAALTAAIEKENKLDLQVYQYAVRKFTAQLQACGLVDKEGNATPAPEHVFHVPPPRPMHQPVRMMMPRKTGTPRPP